MDKRYILGVAASPSWPYGTEAPVDENGRALSPKQYKYIKIPEHILKAQKERSEYWANITEIALRRFPALGRGESFQDSEIRSRLRELRKAGYNVPLYSHLRKEEKWQILQGIRSKAARQARMHCPRLLEDITRYNQKLIEEERLSQ